MKKEQRSVAIAFWVMAILCVAMMLGLVTQANKKPHWTGPAGKVTQKMWVQEFWQAGEQLYPARWCLELNSRDEVCIPESDWNKIAIGDWYGAK